LASLIHSLTLSSFTKFEQLNSLGRGTFGEVHRVRTDTKLELACKTLRLPFEVDDAAADEAVAAEVKEAQILRSLRHPNIVRFIRVQLGDSPATVLIFTELVQGVNLTRLLKTETLDDARIRRFCKQVSHSFTRCAFTRVTPARHCSHCCCCITADVPCIGLHALTESSCAAQRHQRQQRDDSAG
jgi:serine/threonine protein kinase